jgi:hypothetical protein
MISKITAAETKRRRSFEEGKKLMRVSMQRFNDGSKRSDDIDDSTPVPRSNPDPP